MHASHSHSLTRYRSHVKKLLLLCLLSRLATRAGVFEYSCETQDYWLSFDDSRLRGYDMNQIIWFSPWYDDPTKHGPYWVGRSYDARTRVVDKIFMAPPLEQGISHDDMPGKILFKSLAAKNLEGGTLQIEALEILKVPPVLEPVKAYLLDGLRFSSKLQKLRYEYINTGDVRPLRQALCPECPCSSEEEQAVGKLEHIQDFSSRVKRSFTGWPNAMHKCYKSKHSTYPVASWDAFLRQFDINEYHREKAPE